MFKSGSRLAGVLVSAAALMCLDARVALAQTQQGQASQEGLQEILVTAQKRTENLQTVPIAITAITADALTKQGVTDFAGVANQSTSINFTPYPSSSNTLILYMRGQGVADANQITQDGSVGLYEDGFYIARPQAETFDLADVERVEVLRGPQGTLYGRNTTGGAVNLISRKPTGEFGVRFSLDGGQRSYVRALGTIDLPKVMGGLSSKVTLLYSNLDGNVKNSGGEDFNKEEQKGARASLRWDTGGIFTADYFYEYGEIDSTPIYYEDPALSGSIAGYPANYSLQGHTWEPIALPLSKAKFNANGLTLAWKLNDATTLRSLTGYRGLDSRFYQDYAGAFTDPLGAPVAGITNFTSGDVVQSNQFTQEIQLVGDLGKQANYVLGVYYFKEHANHGEAGTINIPKEFIPGIPLYTDVSSRYVVAEAKSKAVYGQFTWNITDPLSLTVGARYTKDDRSASRVYTSNALIFAPPPQNPFCPPACQFPFNQSDPPGASNSLSFSKFNPAGTLNMAWTPDINTYLRIATGYKAGGSTEAAPFAQPGSAFIPFSQTFKPENVTTYELGLKSYWFEHRLRANVAAFYSKFSDMQLQFDVDPTNLSIVQSYNAGSAKVKGAEFELLFAPTNDLTLGLNDTVLSSQFDTVYALAGTVFDPATNHASPYQVGQNVASVFRLPYAPNNTVNGNIDWTLFHAGGGSAELYLNYRYQGRQYDTSPTGIAVPGSAQYYSIPAHGVLDGRITWNFDMHGGKQTMKLSLWGRNITNKDYQAHVIGQGAAPIVSILNPATGQLTPQTGYYYQAVAWAPKAMFGAQFQYAY
ncbi:MAG: TonB-dependent receptor [Proteobacteria bacterium]|nr:TonB-dependent receptor [Pseudomonadota bacterium]